MIVTERDRSYLDRLGHYEAEIRRERIAAHLTLPIEERLRRSLAMYRCFRESARQTEPEDPTPLYERARRLGLLLPEMR